MFNQGNLCLSARVPVYMYMHACTMYAVFYERYDNWFEIIQKLLVLITLFTISAPFTMGGGGGKSRH